MIHSVGIYGGAFNPIHEGHIQIAKYSLSYFNEVWIMPCYSHVYGKDMVSPEHRLAMLRIALAGHERITVSSYEIENKLTDGTYETLNRLRSNYPKHEFNVIVGQDNADEIEKWRNWEKLIAEYSFFVYPREGLPLCQDKEKFYMKEHHGYVTECKIPKISSTDIRKLLKEKKKVDLPPGTLEYINSNKLYI
jgi:nicotinate-nucleotide adenylyltransferase